MTIPPRLEAEFTKKLMLVDCQFKIIHLLSNILIKIELLGDWQNSKTLSRNSHPKYVSFTWYISKVLSLSTLMLCSQLEAEVWWIVSPTVISNSLIQLNVSFNSLKYDLSNMPKSTNKGWRSESFGLFSSKYWLNSDEFSSRMLKCTSLPCQFP